MNNLLLILLVILLVWSILYRLLHVRRGWTYTPSMSSSAMGTLNGIGTTIVGGFRCGEPGLLIGYAMITILFLPIIPYKCVVYKEKEIKSSDFLPGIRVNYELYGEVRMSFGEVLSCYALRWGVPLLVLCLFPEIKEFLGETALMLVLSALVIVAFLVLDKLVSLCEKKYKSMANDSHPEDEDENVLE